MFRARLFARAAALAVFAMSSMAACSDDTPDPVSASVLQDGVTRVVLRAWEDTRVGLPPLAITRSDSLSSFLEFINARRDGWQRAGSQLPGIALYAHLYRGADVASRFGFISLRHGGPGYFVSDASGALMLRSATAAEIDTFLAFFGIGVEIIEN
jgi:hypothetical protein